MVTNTDITIYSRIYDPDARLDTWKRTYVKDSWWFYNAQSTATTEGTKGNGSCTIRIPDTDAVVKREDYIVKGNCTIEMQTVKDLKAFEFIKVLGVNYNTFGSNPHIKVVGV